MLTAVTRPLPHDVDLNDFAGGEGYLFVRDGVGIAARGVVARVSAPSVPRFLADIERDDTVGVPGCGPLAIGALPFRPGSARALAIPQVIVGKGPDGHRWITTIGDDATTTADISVYARPDPVAGAYTVRPGVDPAHYLRAVAAARDAVRRGEVDKVVVARDVFVESDIPFDLHAIMLRLRMAFGSSYRYSIDGLVGASPELLVSRQGSAVRSHPLAGTAPRLGDPTTDARLAAELMSSTKNQIEHRIVIDEVHDRLLPFCSYLDWEPEPSVVTVANVQHLATLIEGRLSDPPPNVLDLARLLSPTAALGGFPREEAIALLDEVEGLERGRYGGAVGWVDADGNGTWAVTIRCAEFSADRRIARLFAGGGIVADSDPSAELAETQAKFQAMLSALIRP